MNQKQQQEELVKVLTKVTLRRISMILTGEISDPVNVMGVFCLFEQLPRPAQEFVLDNIYVPKDKIRDVSITDMSEMRETLLSYL